MIIFQFIILHMCNKILISNIRSKFSLIKTKLYYDPWIEIMLEKMKFRICYTCSTVIWEIHVYKWRIGDSLQNSEKEKKNLHFQTKKEVEVFRADTLWWPYLTYFWCNHYHTWMDDPPGWQALLLIWKRVSIWNKPTFWWSTC